MSISFFFFMLLRPPISTLFPYTTLFRSLLEIGRTGGFLVEANPGRVPEWNRVKHHSRSDWQDLWLFHNDGRNRTATDGIQDRKSTRLNSSHGSISYAVFCLKKKNDQNTY